MKTIWKFKLKITDSQVISMPENAEILCVQTQYVNSFRPYHQPFLWALVDDEKATEERVIRTFGTGKPVETESMMCHYIGTYQVENGQLVFHVFEELLNIN